MQGTFIELFSLHPSLGKTLSSNILLKEDTRSIADLKPKGKLVLMWHPLLIHSKNLFFFRNCTNHAYSH